MIKCWICVDVGVIEHYQKFKIHGEILEYAVTLHCSCEKGKQQKIDYTNSKGKRVFTEPISKYFDIFKLQEENKKKFGG
jgi:hypothetical protein